MALEVLDGGPCTTIQDFGRPGHGASGVPEGGAMDRSLLAIANRAIGNRPSAAALEFSLKGPRLRWTGRGRLRLVLGGDGLRQVDLAPGEEVVCGLLRHQAYGYLAVAGGFDVPVVMGSRSTCLAGEFGGLDGRPLEAGDVLPMATTDRAGAQGRIPARRDAAEQAPAAGTSTRTSLVLGAERVGSGEAWRRLLATEWRVATGNRVGLRLRGEPLHVPALRHSQGIPPGAVQVTGSGQPILLLRDHPTIGGYPLVAVVVSTDLDSACQARPDTTIDFRQADR